MGLYDVHKSPRMNNHDIKKITEAIKEMSEPAKYFKYS